MTRQGGEVGGASDKMMGLKGRGRDESEINKRMVRQLWLCQPLPAVTATIEVKLRAVVDVQAVRVVHKMSLSSRQF